LAADVHITARQSDWSGLILAPKIALQQKALGYGIKPHLVWVQVLLNTARDGVSNIDDKLYKVKSPAAEAVSVLRAPIPSVEPRVDPVTSQHGSTKATQ